VRESLVHFCITSFCCTICACGCCCFWRRHELKPDFIVVFALTHPRPLDNPPLICCFSCHYLLLPLLGDDEIA